MFAGLYAKLIAGGVIVLAFLAAIGKIFLMGKAAARGEQAQANERTRDAIDKARADGPHDRDDAVDRLRKSGF